MCIKTLPAVNKATELRFTTTTATMAMMTVIAADHLSELRLIWKKVERWKGVNAICWKVFPCGAHTWSHFFMSQNEKRTKKDNKNQIPKPKFFFNYYYRYYFFFILAQNRLKISSFFSNFISSLFANFICVEDTSHSMQILWAKIQKMANNNNKKFGALAERVSRSLMCTQYKVRL